MSIPPTWLGSGFLNRTSCIDHMSSSSKWDLMNFKLFKWCASTLLLLTLMTHQNATPQRTYGFDQGDLSSSIRTGGARGFVRSRDQETGTWQAHGVPGARALIQVFENLQLNDDNVTEIEEWGKDPEFLPIICYLYPHHEFLNNF